MEPGRARPPRLGKEGDFSRAHEVYSERKCELGSRGSCGNLLAPIAIIAAPGFSADWINMSATTAWSNMESDGIGLEPVQRILHLHVSKEVHE